MGNNNNQGGNAMGNSNQQQPQGGGIMRKLIYFTGGAVDGRDWAYYTLTVNDKNEIVKMVSHVPTLFGVKRRVYDLPIHIHKSGTNGWDHVYVPFIEADWDKGGVIRFTSDDLYAITIRPKHIPTCDACGIFPTFEHISYDAASGSKSSQGYSRICTACFGITEEPSPIVTDHSNIQNGIDAIIDIIKDKIENPEVIEDWDADDDDNNKEGQ